jgi:hypothetical protein
MGFLWIRHHRAANILRQRLLQNSGYQGEDKKLAESLECLGSKDWQEDAFHFLDSPSLGTYHLRRIELVLTGSTTGLIS